MRDERPCIDCPDRHVGCHADCKREQAWLETEQARLDGIYAAKHFDDVVDDFRVVQIQRTKKRVRRKK